MGEYKHMWYDFAVEERPTKSFSLRTVVRAAVAGLTLGVVLGAAAFLVRPSCRLDQPGSVDCNLLTPALLKASEQENGTLNHTQGADVCQELRQDLAVSVKSEEECQTELIQIKPLGSITTTLPDKNTIQRKQKSVTDFYDTQTLVGCRAMGQTLTSAESEEECQHVLRQMCAEEVSIKTLSGIPQRKKFTLFTKQKMSWYQALADCHSKGMYLASVENEEEYNNTLSLIKTVGSKRLAGEDFWLSGTNSGDNGTFVWMFSGNDVTYNQWGEPEPKLQPKEQQCIEINKLLHNKWKRFKCSYKQFYICQNRV